MAEALPREDLKDVEDVVLKVENEDLRSDDESPNQHSPGRLTPIGWVKLQMELGVRPEELLQHMLGPTVQLPSNADEVSLWEAVLELVLRPPPRPLLDHVTSLDDVVGLIEQSQKIIVLSGAGMSVSCGIPDFRSPDGLYAKLAVLYPELTDPQSMFDIKFFQLDPRPFFNFAKEIFPGKYQPSVSHRFVKTLEEKGKLLRNYTQNIDTLEQSAGIERVIYCHGSFMTATCRKCKFQAPIDTIKDDIMNESIPYCAKCCNSTQSANETEDSESEDDELGIMKPDIVFFGEGLPDSFHQQLHEDKTQADLLIVIGSSLKVRPVSLIPTVLPSHVPQVLINREPLQYIPGFDVRLLGYSDTIVTELCRRLGKDWIESIGVEDPKESQITSPEERIHLFEGSLWVSPSPEDSSDDDRSNEKVDQNIKRSHKSSSDNSDNDDSMPPPMKSPRTNNHDN